MRARLAVPMSSVCCHVSRCPRLAWVDSREARVISRLPLRPMRAGTMINSSDQSDSNEKSQSTNKRTVLPGKERKTGQYWTMSKTSPAATIPRPAHT